MSSTAVPRPAVRAALALALGGALVAAALRSRSLLHPLHELGRPHAGWLALALVAELAALVAYTAVVRRLLLLGGIRPRLAPLLKPTVGGIALGASLPGGQAASGVLWYRHLRRAGADGQLAGLAMVGAMLAGTGSLAVLLVAGVAAAGAAGPLAAARLPLLYGLGALLLAAALLRRPAAALVRGLLARLAPELPRRLELSRRALATIVGAAFANWLLDVVCLYVSLRAMHASAPLQAILPAFALAQLVASIPLLPGGGGTVEATLALGLAALGHTSGSVLAGILLFRLVSCWGLVPVGWLVLALDGRRPPRLAHARRRLAPVQASLALPLGATGPGARVGS